MHKTGRMYWYVIFPGNKTILDELLKFLYYYQFLFLRYLLQKMAEMHNDYLVLPI